MSSLFKKKRSPFQSFKPFVYTSSNGHAYCFRGGGGIFPFTYNAVYKYWSNEKEHNSTDLISTIPSGYVVVERIDGIPHLISENHTRSFPDCQWGTIAELIDNCDQTWYTMAMVAPEPRPKKEALIREWISELENIEKVVSCPECRKQLSFQIRHQKNGIGIQE